MKGSNNGPITLYLREDGPSPDPLEPETSQQVNIVNELGVETTMYLQESGVLNPSPGNQITVPVAGTTVQASATPKDSAYVYMVPDQAAAGPRFGTIDVG